MWPAPSADSVLPATLYKFCIILARNSFLRSKTDSSKGEEGLEAGRGRGEMHPKPLTRVLENWRTGRPRQECQRTGKVSQHIPQGPGDFQVQQLRPRRVPLEPRQCLEGFRVRAQEGAAGRGEEAQSHPEPRVVHEPTLRSPCTSSEAAGPFLRQGPQGPGRSPSAKGRARWPGPELNV